MRYIIILTILGGIAIAFPKTITVDDDQIADYSLLKSAVDAAKTDDTLIVYPGVYTGNGNSDITINRSLTIRSLDPNDPNCVAATVIDCKTGQNPAFTLSCDSREQRVILSGLTIQNGFAVSGGAVTCNSSGEYTIANCVFRNNAALDAGGAVNGSPGLTLFGCTFIGNRAEHSGGAVYCPFQGVDILDCSFTGNSADNGGAMYIRRGYGIIENSLFAGNVAGASGGALFIRNPDSGRIRSATIAGNVAGKEGGGIYFDIRPWDDSKPPGIQDSIIWGNTDSGPDLLQSQITGALPKTSFCCIQDEDPDDTHIPWAGLKMGNLDDDPRFVRRPHDGADGWGDDPFTPDTDEGLNDDFGDLRLQDDSPCINAGQPATWTDIDKLDINGLPRTMGLRIDMGAHEFHNPTIVLTHPTEGEVWAEGSTHMISWTSLAVNGPVSISLSTNSDQDWRLLAESIPNIGSFAWVIPDGTEFDQCCVRVLPAQNKAHAVVIDSGQFAIRPMLPGLATDSPWPSQGGGFQHTGLSQFAGPHLGKIAWTFECSGGIINSVAVGFEDRLHIACEDGKLYTLDSTGNRLWDFDTETPLLSAPSVGNDGTLYVGGRSGRLFAIDVFGALRWTHDTQGPIFSSPAVSQAGQVYIGSMDGTLTALHADGTKLWRLTIPGPKSLSSSILASPALGLDGTIYVGALYSSKLYAFNPDGTLKWTGDFSRVSESASGANASQAGAWSFTAPVVAESGVIYQSPLFDRHLYAIDPHTGSILWRTDLLDVPSLDITCPEICPGGWSQPALGPDGTIYVGLDDAYVRAVNPQGDIMWALRLGDTGGFTLSVDKHGQIFAASDDGTVYLIAPNGSELAQFETGGSPAFPVLTANNRLIVTDSQDYTGFITGNKNTVWAIYGESP
jgi:outer membrane protein assembly factor BamB